MNKRPKKLILYSLLLILLTRGLYYYATEGFCPDRIMSLSHSPVSTATPPSQPVFQLLKNNSFHYLKKGSQAYAFESADKKLILKLFKRHHMQDPLWLEKIPSFGPLHSWKNTLLEKRRRRLNIALSSYVIATTTLKEQCGILAYQLEPTILFTLPIELIDGIGRKREVDLARCGYVLQKKASLVFSALDKWIRKNDLKSCHDALSSLVQLIAFRSHLGIEDVDPDVHKNAGLVGTEAIFIDIGSFTDKGRGNPLSKESFSYDIKKIFKELRAWLEKKEPHLALDLDHIIDDAIARY